MPTELKIGVDGGGTKTEVILVGPSGGIVTRQVAPGCNPSVVGPEQAQLVLTESLRAIAFLPAIASGQCVISTTLLCLAGNQSFWREIAATLTGLGRVSVVNDSLPVLELATEGGPGLVLHAGTGSFVAARAPDGMVQYAGGLGWRFGDPGSGYDLGRRTISRALLEYQGWLPESRLGTLVRDHTRLDEAGDISRYFYTDPAPNPKIAALAPAVLRLAAEGDQTAHALVLESVTRLLELAVNVAEKLFPGVPAKEIRAGLSGPILTQAAVVAALRPRAPFPLIPVTAAPIEGVRRLLARPA